MRGSYVNGFLVLHSRRDTAVARKRAVVPRPRRAEWLGTEE